MKVNRLIDTKVILDPPSYIYRWNITQEQIAKELRVWASDIEEFIRDHRSQDPVSISVQHEYQEQCSHCGREWEQNEEGPLCCDKAMEEWKQTEVVK